MQADTQGLQMNQTLTTHDLFCNITDATALRDYRTPRHSSCPPLPAGSSHHWRANSFDNLNVPIMGHDIALLELELNCLHHQDGCSHCQCVADRYAKAVCFTCHWESTVTSSAQTENLWRLPTSDPIHEAHDHACPGWRRLPALPTMRGDADFQQKTQWRNQVSAHYPKSWHQVGAPVITIRTAGGTRSVPGRSPWGGYDIAATPTNGRA